MAKLIHTLICDNIRFERGNKISLMGIYGGAIFVPKFPFTFQHLAFLQCWTEIEGDLEFKVALRGEGIKGLAVSGKFQGHDSANPSDQANIALNFSPFVMPRPGSLIFETQMQGIKDPVRHEVRVDLASADLIK